MHDGSQGNPMTEIALALAMGFFSIMVLTVISMGTAQQPKQSIAAAIFAPPAKGESAAPLSNEDVVVVYHDGKYFDSKLNPVSPDDLSPKGRLILAIDPALPLGEAMSARSRFSIERLVVSTLSDEWLKTLKRVER